MQDLEQCNVQYKQQAYIGHQSSTLGGSWIF